MKRIGVIITAIISFLLIASAGVYFFGVFYFRHWFIPNTYINGINVSNKNFDVTDNLINDLVVSHNLVIEDEDGTQIFVDGSAISPSPTASSRRTNIFIIPRDTLTRISFLKLSSLRPWLQGTDLILTDVPKLFIP